MYVAKKFGENDKPKVVLHKNPTYHSNIPSLQDHLVCNVDRSTITINYLFIALCCADSNYYIKL